MSVKHTKYLIANSVNETIELLQQYTDAKIISGGTDFILNYKQKNANASHFIDISNVTDLKKITITENELIVGACVTLEELTSNDFIQSHFPVISEAAKEIATPVIRKNATIAGNLLCDNRCVFYNQSEWWKESIGKCLKCGGDVCIATGGKKKCFSKSSSDLAPVLLVCDAYVTVISHQRKKSIPLKDIYTGDGLQPHTLNNSDLIVSVHIPLTQRKYFFYKLRVRRSIDFSSLTLVLSFEDKTGMLKIGIGAVDPQPILWTYSVSENNFETFVQSKIKKIGIVDNDFFSRDYRKNLLKNKLSDWYRNIVG